MSRASVAMPLGELSLWHLKGFDVFHGLAESELVALDRASRPLRLRRGQILFMPGDRAESVYALKSGLVRLAAISPEGREATVALLERGEIFGEIEAIDSATRCLVATAHEACELRAIPRSAFLALMQRHQDFAFRVSMRLGQRIQEFQSKIACLLFKGAHARLSELLLILCERYGEQQPQGRRIRYRFSHRDLASLIGVSRETVTYALRDFRQQGLVSVESGHIVVRESERLQGIA